MSFKIKKEMSAMGSSSLSVGWGMSGCGDKLSAHYDKALHLAQDDNIAIKNRTLFDKLMELFGQ